MRFLRTFALAALAALSLSALPAAAAFRFSDAARNAANDAIETAIGTAPRLQIFSGTAPVNGCASALSGNTLLADITLPSDWLSASAVSSGNADKTILGGPWTDSSADGTGTASFFRIYNSGVTTCHIQGSVGQGTGDLSLQNTSIAATQQVSVTAFTLRMGGG